MTTGTIFWLKLAFVLYVAFGTALVIWIDAGRTGHALLSLRALGQALVAIVAALACWGVLRRLVRGPSESLER